MSHFLKLVCFKSIIKDKSCQLHCYKILTHHKESLDQSCKGAAANTWMDHELGDKMRKKRQKQVKNRQRKKQWESKSMEKRKVRKREKGERQPVGGIEN